MNDEKIINALLSTPTVKEAAASLEIAPTTIYNRLRDEEFRAIYAQARREVLEENCLKLQSYLSDAIEQIHSVAIDEMGTATQIRLNACDMLLRNFYKLTELTNILERIDRLEKIAEAEKC